MLAEPPDSILTISLSLSISAARASDRRSPAKLPVRLAGQLAANHQTSQAVDRNLSFESCFILADTSLQSKCRGVTHLAQINKFWLLSLSLCLRLVAHAAPSPFPFFIARSFQRLFPGIRVGSAHARGGKRRSERDGRTERRRQPSLLPSLLPFCRHARTDGRVSTPCFLAAI